MTFCCTLIGPFVPRDLYPAFWLVEPVVAPLTTSILLFFFSFLIILFTSLRQLIAGGSANTKA